VLSDVIVHSNAELRRAAIDFATVLAPRLLWRAIRPGQDVISSVARQWRRGELTFSQAMSTVAILLIGHETTASLLSSTLWALVTHPAELARVRADPDALNAVIEETLRYNAPTLTTTLRHTRRPLELAGQRVDADEWVLVSQAAANHDAAVVVDPATFDSTRPPPHRHLAFGHGIHFCLGAHLARMETRIAITELLNRYPNITVAVPPDQLRWRRSVVIRRLEQLPVELGPATAPAALARGYRGDHAR
jgi:cytochrome P450